MLKKSLNEILYNKILNFIAYKPRTINEVISKFNSVYNSLLKTNPGLGDQNEERGLLMTELQSLDLLNDLEYAKSYIKEKTGGTKSISKKFIEIFLLKKGVDRGIIEEAFAETLFNNDSEKEAAQRLLDKKIKLLHDRPVREIKRRATQYLLSKGFSYDIVFPLVDTKTKFH